MTRWLALLLACTALALVAAGCGDDDDDDGGGGGAATTEQPAGGGDDGGGGGEGSDCATRSTACFTAPPTPFAPAA